MNEKYYGDDDYLFKIPISSFIYEFDELSTNKIEIKLKPSQIVSEIDRIISKVYFKED